jgi:hypothetical protein
MLKHQYAGRVEVEVRGAGTKTDRDGVRDNDVDEERANILFS